MPLPRRIKFCHLYPCLTLYVSLDIQLFGCKMSAVTVPKHSDLFRLVLESLRDGKEHYYNECVSYVIQKLNLSEKVCQQTLPNSSRPLVKDRVQWALTYVRQAGLIESKKRGYNCLTEEGKYVLTDPNIELNKNFLMRFESFRKFVSRGKKERHNTRSNNASTPIGSEGTPREQMDAAFNELNRALETEILDAIIEKKDFKFFEHLVVDLVIAMGYGSDEENAGVVTQPTKDGGIDGEVSEDKLGFNKIYIQAKCWDKNSTVGCPEVQKFVGALAGKGASKGLFITTCQYSNEAIKFAKEQHGAKVVLVDGSRLAKLMIEHQVGVSSVFKYVVKRLDSDYFDQN